jgi:hypothetical protein
VPRLSFTSIDTGPITLPPGTTQLPAASLGPNVTSIDVQFQRCTTATPAVWPLASMVLSVSMEVSYDNRATWVGGGGFAGSPGNIALDKHGNEIAWGGFRTDVIGATDVRGSVTVGGANSIPTAVKVLVT